jgi:hypothetical protein
VSAVGGHRRGPAGRIVPSGVASLGEAGKDRRPARARATAPPAGHPRRAGGAGDRGRRGRIGPAGARLLGIRRTRRGRSAAEDRGAGRSPRAATSPPSTSRPPPRSPLGTHPPPQGPGEDPDGGHTSPERSRAAPRPLTCPEQSRAASHATAQPIPGLLEPARRRQQGRRQRPVEPGHGHRPQGRERTPPTDPPAHQRGAGRRPETQVSPQGRTNRRGSARNA